MIIVLDCDCNSIVCLRKVGECRGQKHGRYVSEVICHDEWGRQTAVGTLKSHKSYTHMVEAAVSDKHKIIKHVIYRGGRRVVKALEC